MNIPEEIISPSENPSFSLGRFTFFSNFDSGNLGRIELLSPSEVLPELKRRVAEDSDGSPVPKSRRRRSSPDCNLAGNFKCWTRPDCAGTPFENGNRTWFYFGMRVSPSGESSSGGMSQGGDWNLRFNFMNLNKQAKLFSQGFSPVFRVLNETSSSSSKDKSPGEGWRRLSNIYYKTIENQFYMSFVFTLSKADRYKTHYFAFTYPYSFLELETTLARLTAASESSPSIYFHKGIGVTSYENRPIYVLTVSGMNGITDSEESIPLESGSKPKMFRSKKYVFISARVHPGETQSSFIMDGILKLLLKENDPIAMGLRKKYVFKIIPMLNPDGVVRGHYRTDARGINLNRVYGDPDSILHPSIYFAKKLILYAHFGKVSDPRKLPLETPPKRKECPEPVPSEMYPSGMGGPSKADGSWYEMTETSRCSEGDESIADFSFNNCAAPLLPSAGGKVLSVEEEETSFFLSPSSTSPPSASTSTRSNASTTFSEAFKKNNMEEAFSRKLECSLDGPVENLFLYLDIHGHASKRGIFMYGNHFTDLDIKIDSMLLPKLVSINCPNFDFPACNFTEKNMYLKDRHTGAGREGCGRVAVFKSTGLVYSYTLEANFNTGREIKPSTGAGGAVGGSSPTTSSTLFERPPKYTPAIYEEAGKAVAISILDLTDSNPLSRVVFSNSKNIKGVKDSIRRFIKASEEHSIKSSGVGGTLDSGRRLLRRRSAPPSIKKSSASSSESLKLTESSSKIPRKNEKLPGITRPSSPSRLSSAARTTRNKKNNKKSLIPSPKMVVEGGPPTRLSRASSPAKSKASSSTTSPLASVKKKRKVMKRKTSG